VCAGDIFGRLLSKEKGWHRLDGSAGWWTRLQVDWACGADGLPGQGGHWLWGQGCGQGVDALPWSSARHGACAVHLVSKELCWLVCCWLAITSAWRGCSALVWWLGFQVSWREDLCLQVLVSGIGWVGLLLGLVVVLPLAAAAALSVGQHCPWCDGPVDWDQQALVWVLWLKWCV